MEQVQNSCLYLLQMMTAQTDSVQSTKGESSESCDFRKMMEECSKAEKDAPTQETAEEPKAGQPKPETDEAKETDTGAASGPELSDEELARMQEMAALQMLCADTAQNLANAEPTAEAAQDAALQVGETAEQSRPVQAAAEQPVAEEAAPAAAETGEIPVQAAENTTDPQQKAETETRSQTPVEAEHIETETKETPENPAEAETPVFRSVETAPIKVSETAAPVETQQAEPVENQIADKLVETLTSGETRVELQLSPENLGKVTIELTQKEDGSLHIALQAESSQTRALLERDVSGLQGLLSRTTQQEVQVNVSQPQEQQQQQNYDGHQQHEHQQQQQQEERRSGEDFLNQLRLGLITPEAEAS